MNRAIRAHAGCQIGQSRSDVAAGAAGWGHMRADSDHADRHVAGPCRWVVGCSAVMSRHTTFRFCLDPTVEQREVLARHAGAARFAFNQCLRMVKTALTQRKTDPSIDVPCGRGLI